MCGCGNRRAKKEKDTVFLMEFLAQGREIHSPNEHHVCKPPFCTCCLTRPREARKGMEEDVIDNAGKRVNQQANGR